MAASHTRCLHNRGWRAVVVHQSARRRSASSDKTFSSTGRPFAFAAFAVAVNQRELIESLILDCLADAPGIPVARAYAAGPPNRSITSEND